MKNLLAKMHTTVDKWSIYSPTVLRWGLGFVFLWFGWSGLTTPEMWTGLVPEWTNVIAPAETLVRLHGILELVGGLLLFAGIQTRIVSGILFLTLLHTIFLLEFGPIMVRDIGLAAALLSLFLRKEDK